MFNQNAFTDTEPNNQHSHDLSQAHFPIKTKPISVTRDMASKVTLSSEHVDLKLNKLRFLFRKKNFTEEFMQEHENDSIMIAAETFLEMTELDDAPDDNKWKWSLLIGGLIGSASAILFLANIANNLPAFYLIITVLVCD